jgi:hypothetical protein
MKKLNSTKKFFYALLLTSTVLALGACSSSDEQPADTSGQSSGDGVDCDSYPTDDMQAECELGKEMID